MSEEILMPEELDKLQATLVEHMQTSRSMPLDAAHGFLTAVAAHAEQITPVMARAHVLGDIAGEQGIEPLLEKFHTQLLRDLESGEYGPLIMQMPREDGSMLPLPYGWCEGYAQGLSMLGEEAHKAALENEAPAARLAQVFAFMEYEESQLFDPPDESAHRAAVSELGEAAVWLHSWWQQQYAGEPGQ